jgi:hypothetical protein
MRNNQCPPKKGRSSGQCDLEACIRSHDTVARAHATEIERFFDMFAVACPETDAGRLLRRVGKRMTRSRLRATIGGCPMRSASPSASTPDCA